MIEDKDWKPHIAGDWYVVDGNLVQHCIGCLKNLIDVPLHEARALGLGFLPGTKIWEGEWNGVKRWWTKKPSKPI